MYAVVLHSQKPLYFPLRPYELVDIRDILILFFVLIPPEFNSLNQSKIFSGVKLQSHGSTYVLRARSVLKAGRGFTVKGLTGAVPLCPHHKPWVGALSPSRR